MDKMLQSVPLAFRTYGNKGKAPPLLILHGLCGSHDNYSAFCKILLKRLRPSRQILSPDFRNHGESPHTKEHTLEHMMVDLKALIEDQKLSNVSLFGHSMGGKVAMLFGFKFPSLVEKSIIIDTYHIQDDVILELHMRILKTLTEIKLPSKVPMAEALKIVDNILQEKLPMLNYLHRRFLLANLKKKEDWTYYWQINLPVLLKDQGKYDIFPNLGDQVYNGQILFAIGENSTHTKPEYLPVIRKTFPNVQIEYIKDATHLMLTENTMGLLEVCANFLNQVKAP